MKLFEYAVLYHPKKTKKDEEDGKTVKTQLLIDVKRVLANDEKEVVMLAAREIPADYVDKLSQVEVAVRPF